MLLLHADQGNFLEFDHALFRRRKLIKTEF